MATRASTHSCLKKRHNTATCCASSCKRVIDVSCSRRRRCTTIWRCAQRRRSATSRLTTFSRRTTTALCALINWSNDSTYSAQRLRLMIGEWVFLQVFQRIYVCYSQCFLFCLSQRKLYWGSQNFNVKRQSAPTHKWFDALWDESLYPPYALGSAYAMSADLVRWGLIDKFTIRERWKNNLIWK